jgi:integrase
MRHPPKYVQQFIDRTGKPRFYLRRTGFKLVPLPGLPWSPQFMEAYEAALSGQPSLIGAHRTKPGTVSAAIIGYYHDQSFLTLASSTQRSLCGILERFRTEHGEKHIVSLQRQHIIALLRTKKRFAARGWLKAIRALMKYVIEIGLRSDNPAMGIKLPNQKTDGYHSWTEAEIAQFEAYHGPSTRARLAIAILLYTGQRRGDVIRLGRQHIREGFVHVRQQKTGIELAIPIHAKLAAIIAETPVHHLTLLTTKTGKPFSPAGFGNWFRDRCKEAGLSRCSAHGLRKAAARRLAEAGCTMHEIAAITGHASFERGATIYKGCRSKETRIGSDGKGQIANIYCQTFDPV